MPNLFTIPGDPLAGFALATIVLPVGATVSVGNAIRAVCASLCLYCAGLVHNDMCDLKEDRRERPGRPLPSGRIGKATAIVAFLVFLHGGIALSASMGKPAFIVASVLIAAIVLYNHGVKRVPIIGQLLMGSCRGASAMLGAAAVGGTDFLREPAVIAFAGGLTLYIAAVTAVAAKETGQAPVDVRRFLTVAAIFAWVVALNLAALISGLPPFVVFLPVAILQILAVGWAIRCVESLKNVPAVTAAPPAVGKLIRGLLLVQASVVLLLGWPGWIAAGVLIAFWPVSALVARRFYAS